MRRKVQQLSLVEFVGMHRVHLELPLGEGSGLVEHYRAELREGVHVVRSLDENAVLRRAADAPEECQRDGNHEGAWT